jgi:flagellar motor switch protein FliN
MNDCEENKLKTNLERVVQGVKLEEVNDSVASDSKAIEDNIGLINNVEVNLEVKIGGATTTVKELYDMKEGGLLKLDALTTDPFDILLDGKVVMQGELVVVDDNFGIKVLKINDGN